MIAAVRSAENYYDRLGVRRSASEKEIKKSYRQLALKHHPDKVDGGDQTRFREIVEAYETLSDVQKRREYDDELSGRGSSRHPHQQQYQQQYQPFGQQQRSYTQYTMYRNGKRYTYYSYSYGEPRANSQASPTDLLSHGVALAVPLLIVLLLVSCTGGPQLVDADWGHVLPVRPVDLSASRFLLAICYGKRVRHTLPPLVAELASRFDREPSLLFRTVNMEEEEEEGCLPDWVGGQVRGLPEKGREPGSIVLACLAKKGKRAIWLQVGTSDHEALDLLQIWIERILDGSITLSSPP